MGNLKNSIAPNFYTIHNFLKEERYTHYLLDGGRGATKSSFISIEIILGIMQNPNKNAIALRKVGATILQSVFAQLKWALEVLGVSQMWHIIKNPMIMTYKPTGQQIIFKGSDEPEKLKSIKFTKGYVGYIWFEELADFKNEAEIRNITQSLMRGGNNIQVLYSWNPPKSQRSWVNLFYNEMQQRNDTVALKTNYLSVPKEWLGEPFLIQAEYLKQVKNDIYRHEYLGEVIGVGGEVFTNLNIREITDAEIRMFDNIQYGLDFGYTIDPLHYVECQLDNKRKKLYIFTEIHKIKMSTEQLANEINRLNYLKNTVTCDSAEPRTIAQLRSLGVNVQGAKKGADSVRNGIKFLQDLEEIIIDPKRCPNTYREFFGYEIAVDKNGNLKGDYPDKDNHSIDAVRYAIESRPKIMFLK